MKVLFMVNRDFVLYNFRIELAQRLLEEKNEVYICLPYGEKVEAMKQMGCQYIPVEIDNRGTNPVKDLILIHNYHRIFKDLHPDVILTYTTKCAVYGGIVAGWMKIPCLMNVSGLGTALEYKSILQKVMISLYKMAAKHATCVFFQNHENQEFFQKHRIHKGREHLIPGSGVNLNRWELLTYPDDEMGVEFLFVARIIKEKGIEEYLAAAKQIHEEYPDTVFHIAGPCDGEYQEKLEEYEKNGIIKYHGMVQDIGLILKDVHCTIHPSYYPEGISNVCLESAASGRPVITTDRSGCRETVDDGITGYVFAQKNREQLIECVRKFLGLSNEERREMGLAGRKKMEMEFDREIVVGAYLEEMGRNIKYG